MVTWTPCRPLAGKHGGDRRRLYLRAPEVPENAGHTGLPALSGLLGILASRDRRTLKPWPALLPTPPIF
jgi:hypothetical protein